MGSQVSQIEQALADAGAAPMMTIAEVATHLRWSYNGVWKAVKKKQIPAYKPGKNYLIARKALALFIFKGKV